MGISRMVDIVPAKTAVLNRIDTFVAITGNKTYVADDIKPRKWALVDITKHFNNTLKKDTTSSDKVHQILWFNKPHWIESHDFMSLCDYKNCEFSLDRKLIKNASAIIFCIIHPGMGHSPPVKDADRDPNQVWVVYGLEPPFNYYFSDYASPQWRNTLNWSITYRTDADVQEPYGMLQTRETVQPKDYEQIFRGKKKFAIWVVSHCNTQSRREDYVREMQNHVSVDIYGACGTRFREDIGALVKKYKFFLSFENSMCPDYVSEKVFRYFNHDVIQVVRGGADYDTLLPNDTFINTAKFPDIKTLTEYLTDVGSDQERYISYLRQKDVYKAHTESFTYKNSMCNLCRKLNSKNSYRNTYADIRQYIQETRQCIKPQQVSDIKS